MSDFRITWEAPLDTSVVDNIAIFRYGGITSDCSVVLNDGDLVSETIAVNETSYDDLGAPDLSQVTYAVFSQNSVGYSACAISSESVSPVLVDAPTGIQHTVLALSHAPTGIQTRDADITVGPEGLTAVWQTNSSYAIDGGHYVYPLFLSEAESNYTDLISGGSGASHTMVYNGVTYFMPNNGGTHAGTSAPSTGTYFDSGVEIEKLNQTDEAPRDISAQLQGAVVAPDASQSPTSINSYADADGDGIYSNEDVDDTNEDIGVHPSSAESPDNIQTEISQSTVDGQGHHVYSFRVSNTDPVLYLDSGSISVYKEYEGVNPTTGTLSKLTIGSSAILLFDASDAGNYAQPFSPATEGVLSASFVPTASTAFGGWQLVEFSDINSNGFYEKVTLTFNPFWMGLLQSPDNIQAQEQTVPLTAPSDGPTSLGALTSPSAFYDLTTIASPEAPSNVSTIASPEAPSNVSTIASPKAPSNVSTIASPGEAPSSLTSVEQAAPQIATFAFKEFSNSGAVGLTSSDGYQAFYDSYSANDGYTLDIIWNTDTANPTEGSLEMVLTDDSGVSETVYTYSGAYNSIPLFSTNTLVDNENLSLGFDNNDITISGDTVYQYSFYVEKRDGSIINSVANGESFNLVFDAVNAFNTNTFTDPSTGNQYYYTYGIDGYSPDFAITRNSISNGHRFRLEHNEGAVSTEYNFIEIYTNGTSKSIFAGWGVVENMNGNLVESFTITNNTSYSIPPPAPVANQSPTSLTAAEEPGAPSVGPTILTNTVVPYTPLTFVDIAANTFFIGSPRYVAWAPERNQQQIYPAAAGSLSGQPVSDTDSNINMNYREVTLTEDYRMSTTPVTRAQYLHVMSDYVGHIGDYDTVTYGANPPSVKPDNFNVPVHYVSWLDAQAFVDRLNTQEPVAGWEYVLPTEAQWEYACKAVSKTQIEAGTHWYTKYWLGDTITQADANYGASNPDLAEVQQYNPNPFGIYDQIGGVKEWTADIYANNYVDYTDDYTPLTDPAGGPSMKFYDRMVVKGGLWRSGKSEVRSADRNYNDKDFKFNGLGFRVAMVKTV